MKPSCRQGIINGCILAALLVLPFLSSLLFSPHNNYLWSLVSGQSYFCLPLLGFLVITLGTFLTLLIPFTNSNLREGGVNLISCSYLFTLWIPLAQTQACIWEFLFPNRESLSKRAYPRILDSGGPCRGPETLKTSLLTHNGPNNLPAPPAWAAW